MTLLRGSPSARAHRRPRRRAAAAPAGIRADARGEPLLALHGSRSRRDRQVSAGHGATFVGRWSSRHLGRTLPVIRGGNHVLAARRGPPRAGRRAALREALPDDDQRDTVPAAGRCDRSLGGGVQRAIFWAVRRGFEAVARRRPLVVCFEDLHWAEPTMLDLIEYIVGWTRDAPILVLAVARPELVEDRPQWNAPHPSYEALTLGPLLRPRRSRWWRTSRPAPRCQPRSGAHRGCRRGKPALRGADQRDGNRRRREAHLPPSIQALLAERLDRLSADEREVIERASVVGRDFPVAAVAGLFPAEQRPLLAPQLFALARKGFIRPDPSPSAGEDRFSFQHVLVRDAAYEAMPKELRAALHERLADRMVGPSASSTSCSATTSSGPIATGMR